MAEPVVPMTPFEYTQFWKHVLVRWGVWMTVGFMIAVTTGILIACAILRWLGWWD